MVVLAASIVSKTGKVILSRQFVEISRSRIEGLLTAFPKLVGTGRSHTFVETESVRYVYQPLDQLYLLLITTKSSNIIEDLETLRTFGKVIPEHCRNFSEDEVSQHVYDIVFSFDELISLGLRERMTPAALKAAVTMDSPAERIWEIKQQQQHAAAREQMQRKAEEIERLRREHPQQTADYAQLQSSEDYAQPTRVNYSSAGGYGGGGAAAVAAGGGVPAKSKGLTLGKRNTADALLRKLEQEGAIDVAQPARGSAAAAAGAGAAAASAGAASGVRVAVEEKISAQLPRDGGVQSLEVRGDLTLTINTATPITRIQLRPGDNSAFNFKSHPKLNRQAFADENALMPRDPQTPFPVNTSLGVLKWHVQAMDERLLPISVTCWPAMQDTNAT